jgi:hypothetical protein
MMKIKKIFAGTLTTAMVVAVISVVFAGPAYCEPENIALFVQETPAGAGKISPGTGVHHFGSGEQVVLTAVPRSGYQFVYWLGDVSDPAASSTITYLTSPKIIIAVFERVKYEFLAMEGETESMGGSNLVGSGADYSNQGYSGGGSPRPSNPHSRSTPEKPEEKEGDFPVPDKGNDFPVPDEGNDFPVPDEPIPEPATGILMILGSLAVLSRRKTKKAVSNDIV